MFNKQKLLIFSIATAIIGFLTFSTKFRGLENMIGAAVIIIVAVVTLIEYMLHRSSVHKTIGGALGLVTGLLVAHMAIKVTTPVFNLPSDAQTVWEFCILSISILAFYSLGESFIDTFANLNVAGRKSTASSDTPALKILDTSVIIDGRIADLCETGFLEGIFLVPQFILQELQHIADSSDSLKRARGRRGLDVLDKVQKMAGISVKITDEDFPNIKEVDAKLVALGKKLTAKVVTNDINLNKVAELQGVKVLNINELCNALKPIVLPGETMTVFVLKEGKEAGQGIAYLDDGTMIVVDDAKRCIGKSVEVLVTSILQTTAGRMIFTRLKDGTLKQDDLQVVRNS